jgi:hypothetical protein
MLGGHLNFVRHFLFFNPFYFFNLSKYIVGSNVNHNASGMTIAPVVLPSYRHIVGFCQS